jgi:hypothetical protein
VRHLSLAPARHQILLVDATNADPPVPPAGSPREEMEMLKSTVLPAVLAASMLAALAPAWAETRAVPEAQMPATPAHGAYSVSGLDAAALAQIAGAAGVTVDQAKGMTLSQLYFLKEGRDSDDPAHWKGQPPLTGQHIL